MKKRSANNNISSEVLAAFLDGNATAAECHEILDALATDDSLREFMHISRAVDADLGLVPCDMEYIPMTACAAASAEGNTCSLECEKYILHQAGVEYDEAQMQRHAIESGWLKAEGTALHNVGRHLESFGYVVRRQYMCTVADIAAALAAGCGVIVAVDGGELVGDRLCEVREDIILGERPDHTVVVVACDEAVGSITIYDPDSPNRQDTYPLAQFVDAWNDSRNYLVTINFNEMETYKPTPIDVSDVTLPEDLNELREAIAENAHDVWAVERQAQGWTYGDARNDELKQTPCMVPYSKLEDSEKVFDRDMAITTLKLVKKLGYDIVKSHETALYKELLARLREADHEIVCPYCACKGKNTPVFKHDVYCRACGHKLDIDWSQFE